LTSLPRQVVSRGHPEPFWTPASAGVQKVFLIQLQNTSVLWNIVNPNVAKVGGLQSQGAKGEAVVVYRESLTTPDLMSSGFPEG